MIKSLSQMDYSWCFFWNFRWDRRIFSLLVLIYSWWQINCVEWWWIQLKSTTLAVVKNRFRIVNVCIEYDSFWYKCVELQWSQEPNSSTNHYRHLHFFFLVQKKCLLLLSSLNGQMMINFSFFLPSHLLVGWVGSSVVMLGK